MPTPKSAPLSPNWRGVIASDEPQRFIVPIWVMALGAIAVATAIYVGLSMGLSSQADRIVDAGAGAAAAGTRADLHATSRSRRRPPPVEPVEFALVPEFEASASRTNLRAALNGTESVSLARLVIQGTNPELFQSVAGRTDRRLSSRSSTHGQGDRRQ